MNLDILSERRLESVHPRLQTKIMIMQAKVNFSIRVTQALRTWAEQAKLYAQGRDGDTGKIVTHARAGYGWHEYGLAADVVPMSYFGQPDWNLDHPAWKQLVAIGIALGMESGSQWRTFKDYPHFQLRGSLPSTPDDSVRALYRKGGILAVWQAAFPEENSAQA